MTDDIVARLREEGFVTHMARLPRESKLLHEAADEIELLRKRLREIRDGFEGCCAGCEPVGEMNKRLREERDEARREVCVLMQRTGFLRGDYATERGWDCYRGGTR